MYTPFQMVFGAGTVTTPEMVRMAFEAGAKFIISPDMDPAVIHEIDRNDMMSDSCEKRTERHSDRIVADMPEMLRLVGVRCGKFDKDPFLFGFRKLGFLKQSRHIGDRIAEKSIGLERDIHECLDRFGGSAIRMIPEKFNGIARQNIGSLTEHSGKTEAVDRDVAGHALRTEFGKNIPSGRSPV